MKAGVPQTYRRNSLLSRTSSNKLGPSLRWKHRDHQPGFWAHWAARASVQFPWVPGAHLNRAGGPSPEPESTLTKSYMLCHWVVQCWSFSYPTLNSPTDRYHIFVILNFHFFYFLWPNPPISYGLPFTYRFGNNARKTSRTWTAWWKRKRWNDVSSKMFAGVMGNKKRRKLQEKDVVLSQGWL